MRMLERHVHYWKIWSFGVAEDLRSCFQQKSVWQLLQYTSVSREFCFQGRRKKSISQENEMKLKWRQRVTDERPLPNQALIELLQRAEMHTSAERGSFWWSELTAVFSHTTREKRRRIATVGWKTPVHFLKAIFRGQDKTSFSSLRPVCWRWIYRWFIPRLTNRHAQKVWGLNAE